MAVVVGIDHKLPFFNLLAEYSNPRLVLNWVTPRLKETTQTLHPACYRTLALYHNLLQFANED